MFSIKTYFCGDKNIQQKHKARFLNQTRETHIIHNAIRFEGFDMVVQCGHYYRSTPAYTELKNDECIYTHFEVRYDPILQNEIDLLDQYKYSKGCYANVPADVIDQIVNKYWQD